MGSFIMNVVSALHWWCKTLYDFAVFIHFAQVYHATFTRLVEFHWIHDQSLAISLGDAIQHATHSCRLPAGFLIINSNASIAAKLNRSNFETKLYLYTFISSIPHVPLPITTKAIQTAAQYSIHLTLFTFGNMYANLFASYCWMP